MSEVYHTPIQLSLFPIQKQRRNRCIFMTLVCDTCGKEFEREKTLHERRQKQGRKAIYCSNACNRSNAKEWPSTLGEEYLAGASIPELARKYLASPKGIWDQLTRMGIQIRKVGRECITKPASWKGKPRPDDVKRRIGEAAREREGTPEARARQSQRILKRIAEGKMGEHVSKVEKRVGEELTKRSISFTPQYNIRDVSGKYVANVDFMLADGRAIEVNGTYWHADPRKYPNGPIYDSQKQKIVCDKRKQDILTELDIPLIVLWEIDLRADLTGTLDKAL